MANKRKTISKLDLRPEARVHWFLLKTEKTTMQVIHLGQKELAERWRMSEATLERWRSDRIGPVFLKIRGRVLYPRWPPKLPHLWPPQNPPPELIGDKG